MNTYRAISDRAKALQGTDVFEADLTAGEEADELSGGHWEIVPRTYRQLSNNYEATEQGETFEAALLVEQEAALISGGHIERVDTPKAKSRTTKKKED